MSTAEQFLSLFDAEGRFRAGDGVVDVVFLTDTGRRYPGRLEFKDGLCVSADMAGSSPWVYPDGAPLSGLRFLLTFGQTKPLVVAVHEGRLLTPEAVHGDAQVTDVFAQLNRAGVTVNQRARTALLSLSAQEQIDVLEAVLRLVNQPSAQWPPDSAPRIGADKPVYLLTVSQDLRAFIRVTEGRHREQLELVDVVPEATLQAFLNRSRVPSGAK